MPKNPQPRRQQARFDPNRGTNAPEMIDLVDAGWILKALGGMLVLGILCAYVTLCVLFSHAQWQLVLHPSRSVDRTPAAAGLTFSEVHFGVDSSGQPQLDGWWIPSDEPTSRTALVLHGADGTIGDALSSAATLHQLHLNVLLFDYRGYGRSSGAHPIQSSMQQDTRTALNYLLHSRDVPPGQIVLYGQGVGGPLALQLCATAATECRAMILDAPDGDLLARASADPRAKIVPTSLLFHERFPLAEPLGSSTTPKLLITYTAGAAPQMLKDAHDPKMLVELKPGETTAYLATLRRFLDEYAPND